MSIIVRSSTWIWCKPETDTFSGGGEGEWIKYNVVGMNEQKNSNEEKMLVFFMLQHLVSQNL